MEEGRVRKPERVGGRKRGLKKERVGRRDGKKERWVEENGFDRGQSGWKKKVWEEDRGGGER